MARWIKKLPFRELTIPVKMLRGRIANRGRRITPFRELEIEHGSLRMVDGVPLVRVRGTGREMGRALGTLVGVQAAETFYHYMRFFCADFEGDLKLARGMEARMPEWFIEEMRGFAETSELSYDELLLGQTFLDIHKVALCSTIVAHDAATETGEILMGRNLDFPSLDIAHLANIVVVYEGEGSGSFLAEEETRNSESRSPAKKVPDPVAARHGFASVTWPGFLGCITGINEHGLSLSMMLVYGHSRKEHLDGQPFPLVYRRVMQECATLAEAEALLAAKPHCTATNVIIADAGRHAARFQLHPVTPVVEHSSPARPALACTNHYLDKRIRTFAFTWFSSAVRLWKMHRRIKRQKFNVQRIKDALQATGIPLINLQRALMRPERRELEVAFEDLGTGPGRWVRMDAGTLFGASVPEPSGQLVA